MSESGAAVHAVDVNHSQEATVPTTDASEQQSYMVILQQTSVLKQPINVAKHVANTICLQRNRIHWPTKTQAS